MHKCALKGFPSHRFFLYKTSTSTTRPDMWRYMQGAYWVCPSSDRNSVCCDERPNSNTTLSSIPFLVPFTSRDSHVAYLDGRHVGNVARWALLTLFGRHEVSLVSFLLHSYFFHDPHGLHRLYQSNVAHHILKGTKSRLLCKSQIMCSMMRGLVRPACPVI